MIEALGFDSRFWDGNLPAGHPFEYVFTKVTEGTGFVASNWKAQKASADANGLLWGPYHFYRNWLGPEDQAAYFRAEVGSQVGQLPPILDLEDSSAAKLGETPGRVLRCVKEIERLFERKPMIYSAAWWWNPWMGGGHYWVNDYFRWVANYTTAGSPLLPAGWNGWNVWQYRGDQSQTGFNAKIDWNICDKTWLDQFKDQEELVTLKVLRATAEDLHAALHR